MLCDTGNEKRNQVAGRVSAVAPGSLHRECLSLLRPVTTCRLIFGDLIRDRAVGKLGDQKLSGCFRRSDPISCNMGYKHS